MNYLYTKHQHYRLFIDKYKTDRLKKNLKIYTSSKDKLLIEHGIIKEIFNNPIQTTYNIFKAGNDFKITFSTNSDTSYRIDIMPINEKNKGTVNHISFSLSDLDLNKDDYEKLTNKNEMIEILNRIHYILVDTVKSRIIKNYFCIGASEIDSKNEIYKYFLQIVVGKNGFDKLDVYNNINDSLNWGLYFKI